MREIREIVLHATMTGDEDVTLRDLDRKHRLAGYYGCGYHFVLRRNGEVQIGRHIDAAGAHVRGFDKYSVGICLAGGNPERNFTHDQWASLKTLLHSLTTAYPNAKVMGHRDCPRTDTTCPSFDVAEWWGLVDPNRIDVV